MTTPLSEVQGRQRRLTVDEYHRMIAAGILGEDEHVELIDGWLVAMTPQGSLHAVVLQRLTALLTKAADEGLAVRPQLPLTLADSEPEPDLAVVRERDQSRERHPRSALLAIEVAGDSLPFDRGPKAALYARAGIPEYWIVNLAESIVERHQDPDSTSGRYRERSTVGTGQSLTPVSVPGLSIDVAALFR